jgi:hypothetical protein
MNTISDFYRPGSSTLLTKNELEQKYDIVIVDANLIELHYIIKMSMKNIGLKDNCSIVTILPYQPLLINIANITKKGCNVYCKFLKKKINLNTTLEVRENKWHTELQCTFGTNFWNKTYALAAGIKYENKLKWLQFQLNRNSLFTNYKVNKFKPNVSPKCTYCAHIPDSSHPELVSHLFYDCDFVLKLWQELKTWLATLNVQLPLDRIKLLFGIHEEDCSSVLNYIILSVKQFIWKTKFGSKDLSLNLFQKFLFSKLADKQNALNYCGKSRDFDIWNDLYNCMSRLPACTAPDVAPLPTQQAPAAGTPPPDPARTV